METQTMTVRQQLALFAEVTGGNAWGLDRGTPRIYLPSRRDIKLFLSFEDAAYSSPDDAVSPATGLFGVKLNCYVSECGQSPNWYASQKKLAMQRGQPACDAAVWFSHTGNVEEAKRFAEGEIELTDDMAGHLVNGRIDEARALL